MAPTRRAHQAAVSTLRQRQARAARLSPSARPRNRQPAVPARAGAQPGPAAPVRVRAAAAPPLERSRRRAGQASFAARKAAAAARSSRPAMHLPAVLYCCCPHGPHLRTCEREMGLDCIAHDEKANDAAHLQFFCHALAGLALLLIQERGEH